MATYNTYTAEQQGFLRDNCKRMSRRELADSFNTRFGTNKTVRGITSYCNRRGWNSANDGRYKHGNHAWATGLSKDDFKAHYTDDSYERMVNARKESNKKLHLGDEVIRHGVPMIVTSLDYSIPYASRLTFKRRYVWEQAHGKIPPWHRIIHLDGDPMNCELDNLYCVPDKFIPTLNKNHWLTDDRDHTLTAVMLCELNEALKGDKMMGDKA